MDEVVKKEKLSNDHYYLLYDMCSDELKENFTIKNGGKPLLYKDGVGQYDSENNYLPVRILSI